MSKEIALVTYKESPELIDGERLVVDPLRAVGLEPRAVPWDEENVEWNRFTAVVLRSSWDYHTRVNAFREWLDSLESSGANVFNRIPTIRWNMDKHYLGELSQKGVSIIPTLFINQGDNFDLSNMLSTFDRPSIIVKPTFGASAHKVVKASRTDLIGIEKQVKQQLEQSDVMLQPFTDEVMTEGEYSFIFFGKQFSHAVLKKPAPTDYRTQPHYGGSEHVVTADSELIAQAQRVLEVIPDQLLYTRVDGVNVGGQLKLMELELIEPYLFFEQDAQAATRFVSVLSNYLAQG